MSKVFGYPEYDEKGEKILTTYDNEYKAMMMDIRVYRMKAGETRTFLREGEETAVLLLSGNITYKWNGNEATATRKDVFTEGPWCVHGCTGTEITVVANAESQRMKKISVQNFINRKMLRGDIPVWANSEMLQREG